MTLELQSLGGSSGRVKRMEILANNLPIGFVGFSHDHTLTGQDFWRLDLQIQTNWQNKGIATEVLPLALQKLGTPTWPVHASTSNPACLRVLEKCGFIPYNGENPLGEQGATSFFQLIWEPPTP
jgi:RimJ/RimL family protein N-acetyltransferase